MDKLVLTKTKHSVRLDYEEVKQTLKGWVALKKKAEAELNKLKEIVKESDISEFFLSKKEQLRFKIEDYSLCPVYFLQPNQGVISKVFKESGDKSFLEKNGLSLVKSEVISWKNFNKKGDK